MSINNFHQPNTNVRGDGDGQGSYKSRNATTLRGLALALNVPQSAVILSRDTTRVLDDVIYIHDVSVETTYIKPEEVGASEKIVSVVGDQLTTTGGTYTLDQYNVLDAAAVQGAHLYKGSNRNYVQNGDVVPVGITQLRVLIGTQPTVVVMEPAATGTITALTETGATVGGTPVKFGNVFSKTFKSVEVMKATLGLLLGEYVRTDQYYDDIPAGGALYKLVTPAEFGGVPDELADHTHASGNILMLVFGGYISADQCGTKDLSTFDSRPSILSAWSKLKVVHLERAKPYYLGNTLRYTTNASELRGVHAPPFTSNTQLRPMDNTFPDAALIDMNEKESLSGQFGGQFSKLKDVTIFGGMANWKDVADPLAGLIGVHGVNTIDECNMENVTFRNVGVPFDFGGLGFKHNHKSLYIYQCHDGPVFNSTNSSSINEFQIQSCFLSWGSYSRVNIHNATIQQGNEQQKLQTDVGMTCDGVNFTGYLYTEGGNAHIKVEDGARVTVENWEMGFAILLSGAYGNHNISVGTDSEIFVFSGRSAGVKSFLVGGNVTAAKTINLDIEPYDGRFYNSTTAPELPDIPNLVMNRTYASIKRVDFYNEINYVQYSIGVTTVTAWDQFTTTTNRPTGGSIQIKAGGTNTYDWYDVEWVDAQNQVETVNIITKYRNVGGSGDNNFIVSYSAPSLTIQGRKSDQRFLMRVEAWGSIYPKPIA